MMNPSETSPSPLSPINPFTPKPPPMMTTTNGAIWSNLRSDMSFPCIAPSAGQISPHNNNNQWVKLKELCPYPYLVARKKRILVLLLMHRLVM
ncbi:hypothetical protein LguiA_023948 [Lonicera macranthoides]